MTKVKIEKKSAPGQIMEDQGEEVSQKLRKLGRFRELLKPARRPLKPEMEPPETFIKPEIELASHSEPQGKNLMDANLPEVAPLPTEEQYKPSEPVQNINVLQDLPLTDEQELQVASPVIASEAKQSDSAQGGLHEEKEESLLDLDSSLSSEQSSEEPESEGEDSLLDLFTTGAEEEEAAGVRELAKRLEDVEFSDLLAEARETLAVIKR